PLSPGTPTRAGRSNAGGRFERYGSEGVASTSGGRVTQGLCVRVAERRGREVRALQLVAPAFEHGLNTGEGQLLLRDRNASHTLTNRGRARANCRNRYCTGARQNALATGKYCSRRTTAPSRKLGMGAASHERCKQKYKRCKNSPITLHFSSPSNFEFQTSLKTTASCKVARFRCRTASRSISCPGTATRRCNKRRLIASPKWVIPAFRLNLSSSLRDGIRTDAVMGLGNWLKPIITARRDS